MQRSTSGDVLRTGGVVMAAGLHGIEKEIGVGDVVDTVMGEGVVTSISNPMREGDYPVFEVDLGHKWVRLDQVRSIRRHKGDQPEPHWQWDEHD
jgi:hypothetical protein